MTGGSLSFRFSDIIVSLGTNFPSGTKTFRPAEHKVAGTGSEHFDSGSLKVMVSDTIRTSAP